MLPKKDKNPLFVSSWRPITLLNVDYKILTKLFAKCLAKFLPKLIHNDQKGFIAGRSIHDNLLDIQALLTTCDNLNTEGMLVLLDIQKAFDSIGWSFIKSVLITFDFPDEFIRWFDIFYAGKVLHIINNGHISEAIHPTRGVAQGCGISPLFFVLALETLALAIRNNPRIQGITVGGVSKKINLLADDGLLALKWAQSTFNEMVQVLQEFSEVSNLVVNQQKSLIIRIGKNKDRQNKLQGSESFPYFDGRFFRYLGIDWVLHEGKYVLQFNFDSVVKKVKEVAEVRSGPMHSTLGRLCNVRSLMLPRFLYKFSCLPSPSPGWFKKMQSILTNYFWDNKVHHTAMDQMYLPIEEGGFNLCNVRMYDTAIKLSYIDKALHNTNNFWSLQLHNCLVVSLREFLTLNVRSGQLKLLCKYKLPPFLLSVLTHYCDLHYITSGGHIGLMPLAYSSALQHKGHKYLFRENIIKEYARLGIVTIQDFIEAFDNLSDKQKVSLNANTIMNRMPNDWLTQSDSGNFGVAPPIESLFLARATVHKCYNTLLYLKQVPVPKAISRWEQELSCSGLTEAWPLLCKRHTQLVNVKLHSFYLRYLHRAYILNTVRSKWLNTVSPMCSFCNDKEETFLHLYWECTKIRPLWTQFIQWCTKYISKDAYYSRENCLLKGFNMPLLNVVMTICKYHIHLLRFFSVMTSLLRLLSNEFLM